MPLSRFQKMTLPFRVTIVTEQEIGVRQLSCWCFLRREEIAAVKAESVSKVIVRLYDGRRFKISLFRFPLWSYSKVMKALRTALHENRKRKGLWDGAEDLPPIL